MQGDARPGEVEVRPLADGPVPTVLVRQLGPDDSWWVLGSAMADIVVATPAVGDAINSPVAVTGGAAFDGSVEVEVREVRARDPIGTGFVTTSAEDGRVWQAAVLRVQFG